MVSDITAVVRQEAIHTKHQEGIAGTIGAHTSMAVRTFACKLDGLCFDLGPLAVTLILALVCFQTFELMNMFLSSHPLR